MLILYSCTYCLAELSVMAEREVEILSASEVYPYVVLSCNILPANESVRSRWILPNGQILAKSDERFLISIGATDFGRSSILVIPNLSYKDTGFYTCEAMRTGGKISSHVCDGFPVSSSIELLLEGECLKHRNSCTGVNNFCLFKYKCTWNN